MLRNDWNCKYMFTFLLKKIVPLPLSNDRPGFKKPVGSKVKILLTNILHIEIWISHIWSFLTFKLSLHVHNFVVNRIFSFGSSRHIGVDFGEIWWIFVKPGPIFCLEGNINIYKHWLHYCSSSLSVYTQSVFIYGTIFGTVFIIRPPAGTLVNFHY